MKRIRSTAAVLLVILAIAGSFSAWAAELPELHAKALEKHAQNADTVGWLQVPGTRIDDVVLSIPVTVTNTICAEALTAATI